MSRCGIETGLIPIAEAETNTIAFCSAFEMTVLRILVVVNRLSRSLALKSSLNLQTHVSELNVLFFTGKCKGDILPGTEIHDIFSGEIHYCACLYRQSL